MPTKTKIEAKVEVPETPNGKGESKPLAEMVHRVLLASIGAVALTQDEIEKFVNKLIERGEIAEKDGKKVVQDVMDKRKKQAEKQAHKAEDEVSKRVEEILDRLSVPTKTDIDALSEKIAALTKKVDELKKAQ